jgi:hypothetical protein
MREAVDTRELREGAVDFVDACETVEGRADRGPTLQGMMGLVSICVVDECGQGGMHEMHECR